MASSETLSPTRRSIAFGTAILVVLIDQLGASFLSPLVVPLGEMMGATVDQIATFGFVRGLFLLFSTYWLSKLSDLISRRIAICISILGSGIAYFVQASASSFGGFAWDGMPAAVLVFTIGRGLAGFFAGSSPVLQTFVSDLYSSDYAEQKQRLVTLQITMQGLGLVLAPIAGSIASYWYLETPFYVGSAFAAFGLLWAIIFFPSSKKVRPLLAAQTNEEEQKANPYCDGIILTFSLMYICAAIVFNGYMQLLVPQMLLRRPEFGFSGISDPMERNKRLAQAIGLLSLPNGLASLFSAIFLFTPLTERFGEATPLGIAGLIGSCAFPFYGFADSMWQLYVYHAIVGGSLGLIFPAVGPLMAKYADMFYPRQKAQVQAVPMMGMSFGIMVSHNIMAVVINFVDPTGSGERIGRAFYFCGGLLFVATIFLVIGISRVTRTFAERNRHKKFEDAIGDEPHVFTQKALALVKAYLEEYESKMTNRPLQKLVLARMLSAVPILPNWDDQNDGEEYISALWTECAKIDDVAKEFEQTFRTAGVSIGHLVSHGGAGMLEQNYFNHIGLQMSETEKNRRHSVRSRGEAGLELGEGLAS